MNNKLSGYLKRFTLLHVLTYWVIGMAFYQLQGYEEALATMEAFQLWRPLDNIPMVAAVFLGQIVRGGILALIIYPFYRIFMPRQRGWLLLFSLLWGLTFLGSGNAIPELIAGIVKGGSIVEFFIGIPEITVQMLVFSWLFFRWERKVVPVLTTL